MPGPYDYSINIPQPPANNFLQSLLGIQQLKGLQQQSQLAEQQAAIQQQNAQFAAQMQPLQLQAERARIGQIGQATAASEEELRGARLRNEQLQRQSDFQKELVNFTSKPVEQWSESEVRSLAAKGAAINPKATEGVLNFWANQPKPEKALVDDTAMKAGIAIAQNRPDIAKTIVDQAKADAESLGFTTASKFLNFGGSQIDQDPALAYATILGHFGTDKAKLDQLIAASELKGKLEETQAKTEETQAKAKKALGEIPGQEKSLPSAILRDNAAIEKKVTAANEMADKLSQAAEAMRALPSVGSAKEWWINVKPKLGFGENPEIAVRSNAAQLAGLGMLGAESSAMGGAIRSNVQFQYATSKLPDAWSAPQEVAKRLEAQAEVQRKLAQIMTIDAEWNSAFRGSQKATKDERILGMDVAPGTTKAQFKESAAKQLFPPSEPPKPSAPPAANPIEAELRRRGLLK